ncbi:hypothetical protein B0T20DRAFT_391310 [Sordaria brevicollis]|uniref:Gfd2/YDR514C-like C-terminal domain-containing protein n=1 Tax=Sordaria brevicollis TaxID=83679 RepID=A0AAE0UD46_SORBR|nr:hypothetical protein B0T20DRAFT_391310 [Sordaria brevicollis]
MKSSCPAPDAVNSFADLLKFKIKYIDSIFVAIDIEMIDHQPPKRAQLTQKEKLSEVGVAVYDPRAAPSSNSEAGHIQSITVQHTIVEEWAWVIDKTCPNRNKIWHRGIHKASPYTAAFCYSTVKQGPEILAHLIKYLESLKTQGLTDNEISAGNHRQVVILSWDATAETKLFHDYGYWCWDHGIEHWDLQLWLPVLNRFGSQNKTGAERFYSTTGVLGSGDSSITLHNASNDAWAQVATLARFLYMSEETFDGWVSGSENLEPLNMSWVDRQIAGYNAALEHRYVKGGNRNGASFAGVSLAIRPTPSAQQHQHFNPPPSVNDKEFFPGLPSCSNNNKTATKPVWGAKTSTQILHKPQDGRAPEPPDPDTRDGTPSTFQEKKTSPAPASKCPSPGTSSPDRSSASPSPTPSASVLTSTAPSSVTSTQTPPSRTPSRSPPVPTHNQAPPGGGTVTGTTTRGIQQNSVRPGPKPISWAAVAVAGAGDGRGRGPSRTGSNQQPQRPAPVTKPAPGWSRPPEPKGR